MLHVEKLEKSFGQKQVLFGIYFEAQPGHPWFDWEKRCWENNDFSQYFTLPRL